MHRKQAERKKNKDARCLYRFLLRDFVGPLLGDFDELLFIGSDEATHFIWSLKQTTATAAAKHLFWRRRFGVLAFLVEFQVHARGLLL